MDLSAEIRTRLNAAFDTEGVEVHNESAHHAGHAGDDGSGESHWRVRLPAAAGAGMSRIERHRAVHRALGPEIVGRIHALAIEFA